MTANSKETTYPNLDVLATHLRNTLKEDKHNAKNNKNFVLIYAHNGTGKTRLSMAFKNNPKQKDTLYFNAFTEDLFTWDNDLKNNHQHKLKLHPNTKFFAGIENLEMESRIRKFLDRYTNFDFKIDYTNWEISFSRQTGNNTDNNIKISRGEQNLFIWCFFLTLIQLVADKQESYQWVKYLYIDDPVSSLDENHTIALAHNLAQLLKNSNIKTVISSHHPLFFNVIWNELHREKQQPYFLAHNKTTKQYTLKNTTDTPHFHHVATLIELNQVAQTGEIYTYHFNMLRTILEKSASFHGFKSLTKLIETDPTDKDNTLYARIVNNLNHGRHSIYEPQEMVEENKNHFKKILHDFMQNYPFNPELFTQNNQETNTP